MILDSLFLFNFFYILHCYFADYLHNTPVKSVLYVVTLSTYLSLHSLISLNIICTSQDHNQDVLGSHRVHSPVPAAVTMLTGTPMVVTRTKIRDQLTTWRLKASSWREYQPCENHTVSYRIAPYYSPTHSLTAVLVYLRSHSLFCFPLPCSLTFHPTLLPLPLPFPSPTVTPSLTLNPSLPALPGPCSPRIGMKCFTSSKMATSFSSRIGEI